MIEPKYLYAYENEQAKERARKSVHCFFRVSNNYFKGILESSVLPTKRDYFSDT